MPRHLRRHHLPPHPHEEPTHGEIAEMMEELAARLDRIEELLRK